MGRSKVTQGGWSEVYTIHIRNISSTGWHARCPLTGLFFGAPLTGLFGVQQANIGVTGLELRKTASSRFFASSHKAALIYMTPVRGIVAPGFEPVKKAFASLYSKGWEVGSSFAVFLNDKLVCSYIVVYASDMCRICNELVAGSVMLLCVVWISVISTTINNDGVVQYM